MKYIIHLALLAFLSLDSYAQPDWTPVFYTNSTTAYVIVTIEGQPATSADKIAAFAGDECRAAGDIIVDEGDAYSTLLIHGETVENCTFKVWDADRDLICNVYMTIETIPGGTIGYPPDFLEIFATTNNPPLANAGEDQSVDPGTSVELNGSASSDPDGDTITFLWSAPAAITLSDTTSDLPTFVVPQSAAASYEFTLLVNDGMLDSELDTVLININSTGTGPSSWSEKINIYPNPTSGTLFIDMQGNSDCDCSITLTDISGRKLATINNNGNSRASIDISDYPAGIYTISITKGDLKRTEKIIIK